MEKIRTLISQGALIYKMIVMCVPTYQGKTSSLNTNILHPLAHEIIHIAWLFNFLRDSSGHSKATFRVNDLHWINYHYVTNCTASVAKHNTSKNVCLTTTVTFSLLVWNV